MTVETMAAVATAMGLKPDDNYTIERNFSWNEKELKTQLREDILEGSALDFEIDAPLFEGRLTLDMSYDSKRSSDESPPDVKFKGSVGLDLNFDASVHASVLLDARRMSDDKPVVLTGPPISKHWDEMTFYLGPIPITIKPSVDVARMQARLWGVFNGSASLDVKADMTSSVEMELDTAKKVPMVTNTSLEFKDIRLLPPNFIVMTKDFRLDFGVAVNMSVAPYFNASMSPVLKTSLNLFPELPPAPAPPLCTPHDIRISASADLQGWASFVEMGDLAEDAANVSLSDVLPKAMCMEWLCQGFPVGCKLPPQDPITIKRVVVRISRGLNSSEVSGGFVKQVAYALGLVPSAIDLVSSYISNTTEMERAVQGVEHVVEGATLRTEGAGEHLGKLAVEHVEEEVDKAGQEFTHLMSKKHRRLEATDGSRVHDTFVVKIQESPAFKITAELLQGVARAGGFRFRDGRERELGPIRVTHVGLLGPRPVSAAAVAPHEQLWDRSELAKAPGTGARSGAMTTAVFGTLGALVTTAAAAALVLQQRRRRYLAAPDVECIE